MKFLFSRYALNNDPWCSFIVDLLNPWSMHSRHEPINMCNFQHICIEYYFHGTYNTNCVIRFPIILQYQHAMVRVPISCFGKTLGSSTNFGDNQWNYIQLVCSLNICVYFRFYHISNPLGTIHLLLSEKSEYYTWAKVTTCVHNVLNFQSRWIENYGEMLITCSTGITCNINLSKSSYFSTKKYDIKGDVISGDGEKVFWKVESFSMYYV